MVNLLLMAVMYSSEQKLKDTKKDLIDKYGKIRSESDSYDFSFTDYYEKEMGKNLKKIFLIFEKKIEKQELSKIKFFITGLEEKYSKQSKRTINIDPGYLSEKELVLATFKQKDFKKKIDEKVWVHKILEFNNKEVKEFFHTFADYKVKENQEFFIKNLPL